MDHFALFSACTLGISKSTHQKKNCLYGNIRLHPIHCVKCLIQEQSEGPTGIDPGRTILVQCGIIPQHCEEVHNYK